MSARPYHAYIEFIASDSPELFVLSMRHDSIQMYRNLFAYTSQILGELRILPRGGSLEAATRIQGSFAVWGDATLYFLQLLVPFGIPGVKQEVYWVSVSAGSLSMHCSCMYISIARRHL